MIADFTIENTLMRFADAYGVPPHIDSPEKMDRLVKIYHEELSKHFDEHSFPAAISIAWTKARKFPAVADFFEGYGGKEAPDYSNILKDYK